MTITIDAPPDLSVRIATAASREGMTVEEYALRLLWQSSEFMKSEENAIREARKQHVLAAIRAGHYATTDPDGSSEAFMHRKIEEIAREDGL